MFFVLLFLCLRWLLVSPLYTWGCFLHYVLISQVAFRSPLTYILSWNCGYLVWGVIIISLHLNVKVFHINVFARQALRDLKSKFFFVVSRWTLLTCWIWTVLVSMLRWCIFWTWEIYVPMSIYLSWKFTKKNWCLYIWTGLVIHSFWLIHSPFRPATRKILLSLEFLSLDVLKIESENIKQKLICLISAWYGCWSGVKFFFCLIGMWRHW